MTKEQCADLIKSFENNPQDHRDGKTVPGYKSSTKISKDIYISSTPTWKEHDTVLCGALKIALSEYALKIATLCNNTTVLQDLSRGEIQDTGYYLQKYNKAKGIYDWHDDYAVNSAQSSRMLTFLWYLNDVEEGGETLFFHGKLKPKAGTVIIFPATWTYNHKECIPIGCDKYVVTGWVSNKDLAQNDNKDPTQNSK